MRQRAVALEQVRERVDAKLTELSRVRRDVVEVLESSHAATARYATAFSADQRGIVEKSSRRACRDDGRRSPSPVALAPR